MSYPRSISHHQAINILLKHANDVALGCETIPVTQALGRITAAAINAPQNVPAQDCSRMDGYAINLNRLSDKPPTACIELKLNAAIHATAQDKIVLCGDLAVPVMTGALLPEDANAIILKEQGRVEGGNLYFQKTPKAGQYIRFTGSDLKQGQQVIKQDQQLNVAHLGMLSSLGISRVKVLKKPQIALMVTGDELVNPGDTCLPGQIYDSNSIMLANLFKMMGCEITLLPFLPDDEVEVIERFAELKAKFYDLIVSVGGVSMGDKDWIPAALESSGSIYFHKLRIKPGFPMIFGGLGDGLYFGLPGNPVSAYCTLCQYIYPILKKITHQSHEILQYSATLSEQLEKSHDRFEFMRGHYTYSETGFKVSLCGTQQSSRIESLAQANCFVILDESKQQLNIGDAVMIQPFHQFTFNVDC